MIDKPGSFMDNGLQIFWRIVEYEVRNNPVSKTKRKDEEKE